jgi:hypothetical protein
MCDGSVEMDTFLGKDRLTDDLRGAMGLRTTLMKFSIVAGRTREL